MADSLHPVFESLRRARTGAPLVVAHRGNSAYFPENTLPAFRSALHLGVLMQEFDVRRTRDGVLLCIHDATFDRTTNAAQTLGPGALVAQATASEAHRLDAGAWRGRVHAGTTIPTLAEVITALHPGCTPLIEHKAGDPQEYLGELRRCGAEQTCIVQSFDWEFVRAIGALSANLALAVLGPTHEFPLLNDDTIEAARALGAGMLHWRDTTLATADVQRTHRANLLVCTYTTDSDLGWQGGAALGLDAMCTNDPKGMLASLRRDDSSTIRVSQ